METTTETKLGVIAVVVFLGAGIWAVGSAHATYTQATMDEPVAVEATVHHVGVAEDVMYLDNGGTRQLYYPDVHYTYSYEGETYTSESVYRGTDVSMDTRSQARAVVSEYDAGEAVTATIDGADPDTAYLIDEYSPTMEYLLGASGVFLILAAAAVVRGLVRGVARTA
ncbi:DUF3592 domain-containing protein [Halovivax cerinus]|uniref:DUF3592 domain-containing protein n=1 Tax=Halovivax cerinus TaxID=1487865 RepID=A0ABD5NQB7_9EURY|nr:DUF3592 domain-containing protein [Halovivax cerinus]